MGHGQVTQLGYFAFRCRRAARKIDDDRHAEFFGETNRVAAGLLVGLGDIPIRVERVPVGTKRADGKSVIGELLFEILQGGFVRA